MGRDPARPFLTFYDDATGERTELSYATFDNWAAKTANLLADGLGLPPGATVAVDLPTHWQTVVVHVAAWRAGATVGPLAAASVAFVAEDRLDAAGPSAGVEVVGLSLRPLGAGLARPRPGVTDYAAEVPAYGDGFAGGLERAVAGGADLLPEAAALAAAHGLTAADRLYTDSVRGALVGWVAGAGVVLERRPRPEGWAARLAAERVGHAVLPPELAAALPPGVPNLA